MTDSDLINACLRNDRSAQRILYDRYKRAMYTLAYRLTSDFDDANDVLQDTFLDVFRKLETFKGESTIGAWIRVILVRKAYKRLQKPKLWELSDEIPENGEVTWSNAIDGEYLEKAIFSLPEGFRMVFTLIEIEGYSHKEVANILGISEGTSKSQLFYSKKRLREILS
ncbi:MAG: hypothetical protein RLZZ306_2405 [Bacteroidota bacterium]|jgi:RNA polymerase sigma-70 factor (ECF subfamily)